jgi:hypothetical protein
MQLPPKLLLALLALLAMTSGACQSPDLFTGEPAQLQAKFKRFQADAVPEGWQVEDGAIALVKPGAGDLVTRQDFQDFDLELEWRISDRGNSGIMFHVSEAPEFSETYQTGPEMQVLDNAVFDGNVDLVHAAGANYALHAPPADYTKPVGEWNHARIRVEKGRVQQWLNGNLCCDYVLGSDEWKALVASTKFKDMPGYGAQGRGKIALQDHGNPVWYRNIKVTRLGG